MAESKVKDKSKAFAINIVKIYKTLLERHEFVMSKQLLRSGTSIGANVCEALCGISSKDFLAKMYISYKESVETIYWLDILYATNYINLEEYTNLADECHELRKMLSSITKTTSESLKRNPNSQLPTPNS